MMYPVFMSVVVLIKDHADLLEGLLRDLSDQLTELVSDHELIIVDNGSADDSVQVLKRLSGEGGLPNLQIYALAKEVDANTAAWVGLENALGDFVAVLDPLADSPAFLPTMLQHALGGADVVLARNTERRASSLAYRAAYHLFNAFYKGLGGVDLRNDAPQYRILSKRVINFILKHAQPAMAYRHLPATAGFAKANLTYAARPRLPLERSVRNSLDVGLRLLVSTTRAPMRLVLGLTMFGALANLLYSIYVIIVALIKTDVAPGWVTLSLQQSGMFFLLSLVMLVIGEYILQMASLSNEGPAYHVAQEFTSARITRREKLNVDEVASVTVVSAFSR